MKSVLISTRPKWCEKIVNGEKTIEVRKSRPKIETPFKCYIYQTKAKQVEHCDGCDITYYGCGKVIGEFICDRIEIFEKSELGIKSKDFFALAESCVKVKEMREYIGENKIAYGWHISDLKIYDKPKELSEFRKSGFMTEEEWLFNLYPNTHCHYDAWAKKFEITRPPQSWCYVEELK